VTIYLHIAKRAERIGQESPRSWSGNNIKVAGIQRGVSIALRSTQVRYFRQEDRRGAEEIKRLLSEYLRPGISNSSPSGGSSKVPLRQYEILVLRPMSSARRRKAAG